MSEESERTPQYRTIYQACHVNLKTGKVDIFFSSDIFTRALTMLLRAILLPFEFPEEYLEKTTYHILYEDVRKIPGFYTQARIPTAQPCDFEVAHKGSDSWMILVTRTEMGPFYARL